MKIENLLKALLIHWKYCLSFFVVIAMTMAVLFFFHANFRNLTLFLFRPSKFIEKSARDAVEKNCISDKGYKKSCESIDGYKEKKIEECCEIFSQKYTMLRNQTLYAFLSILFVLVFSYCLAYILKCHVMLGEKRLLAIQIISAGLILWGLLGKLGWTFQSWSGDSIPEQIDRFWFMALNICGGICFFFSYFYKLFDR